MSACPAESGARTFHLKYLQPLFPDVPSLTYRVCPSARPVPTPRPRPTRSLIVSISSRPSRFAALTVLALASSLGTSRLTAQTTTIARPIDIGVKDSSFAQHASSPPYNFTGRVFSFDDIFTGFGSATLIRRHTAVTAAHVVYQTTAGFLSRASFSRGLYKGYTFQKLQVVAVNALTGYASAAAASGENSFDAFGRDMGLLVLTTPPKDENWAVYTTSPTALTDDSGRFVLGYPGVTFDGRTMAYIVPTTPYVEIDEPGSGEFENDEYIAEPGMSGGPIYVFRDGVQQVAAETVGGLDDSSGEFNFSIVHAINEEAGQFLASAEYANGLIKKVKIKGPTTVAKGSTVVYTVTPKFAVASTNPKVVPPKPTTNRYTELTLVSDTVGTPTNPAVTIDKLSNTQFRVKFGASLRSRSQITFTAQYAPDQVAANSSFVVTIQ